jgi:phage gp16-like protein
MMATAQKAVFDVAQQRRRSMIGKVKMAQKQLGIVEDDYRAMLLRETGQVSAANCTEAQLGRMLDALKRAGFTPVTKSGNRPTSETKTARKARALWISLYQLGVVHNANELALEAFAKRQLKVERLVWANDGQMFRLIEALKGMAEKAGWSQSVEGIHPTQTIKTLRLRLCEAILRKMVEAELVPPAMRLNTAAWQLCGMEDERGVGPILWSAEALDLLAKGLGGKLRQAMRPVSATEFVS